jgi:curved DNA-binding protein CbpA
MGNTNIKSGESLPNLKKLYSSDIEKLEKIRGYFKNNRRIEYINDEQNILNEIFNTQEILRSSNKIPQIHFLKVDNFLNQLKSDISEYELENIKNKATYEKRQFDNFFSEDASKGHGNGNVLDSLGIDPYKLYGYQKNQKIDLQDLKNKYKKFAIQTHPDKNNGDTKNFQIIQQSYDKLMEDIKLKQEDKQYNQLKTSSLDFIETQVNNNVQNTRINKDNFNINKFNTVYSENKLEDVSDTGYGDWINNNSYDTEEIKRNNKLSGNTSQFNKIFDSEIQINNDQIQKYSDPRSMFMNNKNTCSELGVDKISNFTGETSSIKYTDYKEAHTTNRLVDPNIKFKQYKDISELETARSNIKDFTKDEQEYYDNKQKMVEQDENERIEKQNYIDNLQFKNYERINNIMLK